MQMDSIGILTTTEEGLAAFAKFVSKLVGSEPEVTGEVYRWNLANLELVGCFLKTFSRCARKPRESDLGEQFGRVVSVGQRVCQSCEEPVFSGVPG